MRVALKRIVAATLLVGSGVAMAAGFGFLADSPMGKFNEDDLKLMNGSIDRALSAAEIGKPERWANEKTSSSGEVTAQRAFEHLGRPCRDLKVVNRHRALEGTGVYTLCREDGQWKLAQ
jgi:surface antigen